MNPTYEENKLHPIIVLRYVHTTYQVFVQKNRSLDSLRFYTTLISHIFRLGVCDEKMLLSETRPLAALGSTWNVDKFVNDLEHFVTHRIQTTLQIH